MTPDNKEEEIDWSLTTWKGTRLQQHREFAALPFRRKLEILEEMAGLAAKLAAPNSPSDEVAASDALELPRVAESPPSP